MTAPRPAAMDAVYREHERFLWQLCYRMTGCAADADDCVQDTFAQALAHPPPRTDAPWRPWLLRVAMNRATDLLRRRKRRAYVGPWLPSPLDTDEPPAHEPILTGADGRPVTTEGRYDLLESVSIAFLLALEALGPKQRAVLLLRDVFDYDVRETAGALAMSETNVKVTHLRARRAMQAYDRERRPPTAAAQGRTRVVLAELVAAMRSDDPRAVEALLADDVRLLSDGGGIYVAARRPVLGRAKVARFCCGIARKGGGTAQVQVRGMNGAPTLVAIVAAPEHRWAPRFTFTIDLDGDGRVRRIYSVLAPRKLASPRTLATLAARST